MPFCPVCGERVETRKIVRVQHKMRGGQCGWKDCPVTPYGKLEAPSGKEKNDH